ncbi:hypothetical protein M0R72_16055 [Candidatus Pacearchaeota archaeon]|jgi:hypothetical protein|nr:hypothetical protein [Candidatus Pacearchaeota archaeon]
MISKEILEDLVQDSPCMKMGICDDKEGHWCILREIVRSMGMENRMAEQMKLMYDYKYMISKKEGYDIGKERSFMEFTSLYGKKFAEVYQEGMTNGELFKKVFGFEKEHTDADVKAHIRNN